jgi:hypothetical protein
MSQEPAYDEDLTLRFRWRWAEHGIYLAVSSIIGLAVLGLWFMPRSSPQRFNPATCETIQARYIAAAEEPPEPFDPFHDTRVLRGYERR